MKATLKYYFSVFLRRLPWFLIPAVTIAAISIIIAMTLPPVYTSRASFVVESPQIPDALAPPSSTGSSAERLQIIQQQVLSRSNLIDVARRHNALAGMATMTPDQIYDAMSDQAKFVVNGGGRSGLPMQAVISFSTYRPQIAAAVVGDFLSYIQREDVAGRTGRAGQTLDFFQQEVDRLSGEMSTQADRILKFKQQNADALPEGQEFRLSQQIALQNRQAQIDRDIVSLGEQRVRMIQIYQATGQIQALGGDSRNPQEKQLDEMRQQLNNALAVYTPSNPRITVLKNRISQLETALGLQPGGSSNATSPLDLQLAEIDRRVNDLEDQRAKINADLEKLTDAIARSTANGVALGGLERDYSNIQGQYNQAATRLSQASTGERIELLSRGQRITILEQPVPADRPSKPNRMLIAVGGTLAGIAAGLALVVLLELLNRSPRRPEDLVKKLGIMPLATIPYIRSSREIVWQRSLKAALILLILIGVPAIVWGIHTYYQPLDLLAARVMSQIGL